MTENQNSSFEKYSLYRKIRDECKKRYRKWKERNPGKSMGNTDFLAMIRQVFLEKGMRVELENQKAMEWYYDGILSEFGSQGRKRLAYINEAELTADREMAHKRALEEMRATEAEEKRKAAGKAASRKMKPATPMKYRCHEEDELPKSRRRSKKQSDFERTNPTLPFFETT
jgi:hypothetical protein